MKKICILAILVLVLLTTLIGCSGQKANPASDFEYTVSDDGYVTIDKYIGESKDVVIPKKIEGSPVTAIGICAFTGLDIESVSIPDTVTTIWNKAFYGCKKLHTVDMGKGVEALVEETFKNCSSLKNLTLSPKLKESDPAVFSGCSSLKELTVPKSFDAWNSELFLGCPLTSLTFEDGVKSVGAYGCFWTNGSLKKVTFPASVKKIEEWTFNVGLSDAYFEGDAPEIGRKPFGDSNTVIHYKKGTKGWEDSALGVWYTLVEE